MNDNVMDISKYIDEQYIFLHAENFNKYGGGANATNIFNQYYLTMKAKMNSMSNSDIAANQKLASITAGLGKATSAVDVYNQVYSGNLLELCMEDVASGINTAMDKISSSSGFDMQAIANSAYYDFGGILSAGTPDKQKLNDFFNLISRCLTEMQGKPSASFAQELIRLGEKFLYNNDAISTVTDNDLTEAERLIRNYLENAANKLNAEGKVSAQSFRGTISNIFNTVICEQIAGTLFSQGVMQGLQDIEQALMNHAFAGSDVKVLGVNYTDANLAGLLGKAKTTSGHTSKVDLAGPGALQLTIQGGDKVFTIEMGLNVSAKQMLTNKTTPKIKRDIHIVSSNIGKLFNANSTNAERYYGYNVFANSGKLRDAYNALKKAISASFFVEWLIGTGEQISGSSMIDTAQFLLVNGKLYSMATIIRNICDQIANGRTPVKFEMSSSMANKKIGSVSDNMDDARQRSAMLREAINTVTIGATLNKGIINQYIT